MGLVKRKGVLNKFEVKLERIRYCNVRYKNILTLRNFTFEEHTWSDASTKVKNAMPR